MKYEYHEFAAIFPLMQGEEFAGLVEDVRANGLNNPVVIFEGKVLDGRNRYRACIEAGFEPHTKPFVGSRVDALRLVWSENFHRRHLGPSQAAAVVVEHSGQLEAEIRKAQPKGGRPKAGEKPGQKIVPVSTPSERKERTTDAQLAAAHGTNRTYVAQARKLKEDHPEVFKKVLSGEATITEAKREVVREKLKDSPPLPSDKYRVVYADPPWSYGNTQPDYHTEQRDHYPTMSLAEICELDVAGICEDNAVLFLWVTSPILEESFRVIKDWGFKYKASFVWDKIKHNMGHYNSVRHELLLVCTRGSCQPEVLKLFDSVQSIERKAHSEKPEEFRTIIDTIYPSGKRIELFARKKSGGWDVYGNES